MRNIPLPAGRMPLLPALLLAVACAAPALAQARAIPVPGGDFDDGAPGWDLGVATIVETRATHGTRSLRVYTESQEPVRVQSGVIPCRGPAKIELHGNFWACWGYHLSLRLEQMDAEGRLLTDAAPIALGPFGCNNQWEDLVSYRNFGAQQLDPRTAAVRLVLAGKRNPDRALDVYFDDLRLVDLGLSGAAAPDTAAQLRDIAGGRPVRVAWTRGHRDDGGVLMGLDSAGGRERVLLGGNTQLVARNPCFTRDGRRVVFSGPEQAVYAVDWEGGEPRLVLRGRHAYVLGTWGDPASGADWVYVGDHFAPETVAALKGGAASEDSGLSVYRVRLDDPAVRELVWDKAPLNRRAHIGADGRHMAGEFPWPNCGLATLPNATWLVQGQGCNPNTAPDGSGRFFYLLGNHRQLRVLTPGPSGNRAVTLYVNTMAGNLKDPNRAVWRPRWSNLVRFFTVNSCDLAPGADAYLGMFDADLRAVQQWVRITDSEQYDADAVAWFGPEPAAPDAPPDAAR